MEQKPIGIAKYLDTIKALLPLLSFLIPMLILYALDPGSFEKTWKGRMYYMFFLWLISLEIILNWEKLRPGRLTKLMSARAIAFGISLALPTIYVVCANYWGLNSAIANWATSSGIFFAYMMPLSTEYLVFAVFFVLIVSLEYGLRMLRIFPISTLFLALIGTIYTIDNLYPYGRFSPFQALVPTTAGLASSFLSLIGLRTTTLFTYNHSTYGSITYLAVRDQAGRSAGFSIAWPCSGIDSLLIYAVVTLLFLFLFTMPWWHKLIYFVAGAAVTYFINILRIATIFVLAVNYGVGSAEVTKFHDTYGQLYSITWIVCYPLIIIGSRMLWNRIMGKLRKPKSVTEEQKTPPSSG